jgi:hypothetical protein
MPIFLTFLTILAWIICIPTGIFTALRIARSIQYYGNTEAAEAERLLDRLKGNRVSFPLAIPGSCFIVSLCWILARHFAH